MTRFWAGFLMGAFMGPLVLGVGLAVLTDFLGTRRRL
jgi:hypothetical protein